MLRKLMNVTKNLILVGIFWALLCFSMECAWFMCIIIFAMIAVIIVAYSYEKKAAMESGYFNLYQFYQMMRLRLTLLGYDHEEIIPCKDFLSNLNYRLVYAYNIGEITSIDIANAIMHVVVDLDDDEQFVFDIFRCVKHMLSNPKVYTIRVKNDEVTLEIVKDDKMAKANVNRYIGENGREKVMTKLMCMLQDNPAMGENNLWDIYEEIVY